MQADERFWKERRTCKLYSSRLAKFSSTIQLNDNPSYKLSKKLGYTYIYSYIYTHAHIYLFIYLMYICCIIYLYRCLTIQVDTIFRSIVNLAHWWFDGILIWHANILPLAKNYNVT